VAQTARKGGTEGHSDVELQTLPFTQTPNPEQLQLEPFSSGVGSQSLLLLQRV
jgi:hypothetical protein